MKLMNEVEEGLKGILYEDDLRRLDIYLIKSKIPTISIRLFDLELNEELQKVDILFDNYYKILEFAVDYIHYNKLKEQDPNKKFNCLFGLNTESNRLVVGSYTSNDIAIVTEFNIDIKESDECLKNIDMFLKDIISYMFNLGI